VENQRYAKRNTKEEYLVRGRVYCGACGSRMYGRKVKTKYNSYKYYRCNAYQGHKANIDCNMPISFRADHVDATVWGWVRDLLLNPQAALEGLRREQESRAETNKPLRDRLAVVDDLLADYRAQLDRALDLYLVGDFPREVLTEREDRLETTIDALEQERADLATQLEARTITDEQIETVRKCIGEMEKGLEVAEGDFDKRRRLIDVLDVNATLAVENGHKVAHLRCVVREGSCQLRFAVLRL
jgi:site-specific DNA recombinase